ncbi:MAG: D-2-hydroxyacid dehydrogenase [Alphaproteobacteria bacterium]|nr:D-2-hydroxyacid dehydrogenase [Alphaproteobacteria bacterium]
MPKPATRPLVYVADEPAPADAHAISPARIRQAARRHPGVFSRVRIVHGPDPKALAEAEIVLGVSFNAATLRQDAPKLRWIQSLNAGVEKLAPKLDRSFKLTNASGLHGPKGGEYGLAAMLLLNHAVQRFVGSQRRRAWEPVFTTPIEGKTVVIAGAGALGQAVALQAKRHRMTTIGINTSGRKAPGFDRVVKARDMAKVLPKADFLVVTLPITPGTENLIDRKAIGLLPDHCGIVNLGRAKVMDYDAMVERLRAGTLAGALLDVFSPEPLPADSPLWDVPNLIVSPHAGVDDGSVYVERGLDIFAANLKRYLAGRKLDNLVDLDKGY